MKFAHNHLILYLKWTDYMTLELYLNEAVKNEEKKKSNSVLHT